MVTALAPITGGTLQHLQDTIQQQRRKLTCPYSHNWRMLVCPVCSEVSACQARISALESELAAAAAEHSSRLAQQQKAFLGKLEQLRQVHNQQVAAAIKEAQVSWPSICRNAGHRGYGTRCSQQHHVAACTVTTGTVSYSSGRSSVCRLQQDGRMASE